MLSIDFLPNIGGIAAHVYELSKALVKEGNDVFVLTGKKNFNDKKYEEIDGIKVYRTYFPRVRLLWILVYALPAWLKLRWLIKNKDIDIIHYHNILPDAFIAKFTPKVSKVQTEHSSAFLEAMVTLLVALSKRHCPDQSQSRHLALWIIEEAVERGKLICTLGVVELLRGTF